METQTEQTQFRGHVDECMKHFGLVFPKIVAPNSKGSYEAKKPFADFCGVSVPTVTRWLNQQHVVLPVGSQLLKLTCFFDALGYGVIELKRAKPATRSVLELIGYGVLTPDEVVRCLNYTSTTTLYQVLEGKTGVSTDRDRMMWELYKTKKEALEAKKVQSRELLSRYAKLSVLPVEDKIPVRKPTAKEPPDGRAALHLMQALNLLLRDTTDSDISDLSLREPEHDGTNIILRLSARLTEISSKLISDNREKGD